MKTQEVNSEFNQKKKSSRNTFIINPEMLKRASADLFPFTIQQPDLIQAQE